MLGDAGSDALLKEGIFAYDGFSSSHPTDSSLRAVDELTYTERGIPVDAPLRFEAGEHRDRSTYDAIIDQFAVETNPRYQAQRRKEASEDDNFCYTFVWDVTRALGVEVPAWTNEDGASVEPWFSTEQGRWRIDDPVYWLSANQRNQWLNRIGPKYGWQEVSAKEAQEYANLGHPVVVSAYNPEGFGHIGIVRPGEALNGPALAQAGITNVNHAHVYDYFPHEGTQFFVNN